MKKINVRPTQTVSLEFEDGTIKELKFNSYAMMLLDEEFEDGSMVILVKAIKKPYGEGSKIIYAGLKSCDDKVTYEKAKEITAMLDIDTIMEIIQKANDSVTPSDNGKKKATFTAEEIEMLSQIFK